MIDNFPNYKVCWDTHGGYVSTVPPAHAKLEREIVSGKRELPFTVAFADRNGNAFMVNQPVAVTPKGKPRQKGLFQ
jgi:hypothetical protein